jgi:hypothetical protein
MDFLNNEGFQPDTAEPGEVRLGGYLAGGTDVVRSQPLDCPVGTTSPKCPGTPGAGPGGYTYGDFGRIIGQPEVHADGEIWGETLWDLRTALGAKTAESLVTRAMELSPANPSFLDMRNSILQADWVVNGGKATAKIWKVFAARGMGFFASTVDGDDAKPVEDFSLPPAPGTPTGSLSGTVTDQDTHTPIAGAVVGFGGHASGFPGDFAAVTDAAGRYTINGILPGTYPSVFARADGFDRQAIPLSISSHPGVQNWSLRRDWAALSGGGSVTAFTGPDFTEFGCGPSGAIDQSVVDGWVSAADLAPDHTANPAKSITVKLPRAVNIAEVAIDPGSACGLDGSSATKGYRLETSTNGTTFTVASQGTFTPADQHRLNSVPLSAGTTAGVTFVRFTMLSPQLPAGATCPGPFSGCDLMDVAELVVHGVSAP